MPDGIKVHAEIETVFAVTGRGWVLVLKDGWHGEAIAVARSWDRPTASVSGIAS